MYSTGSFYTLQSASPLALLIQGSRCNTATLRRHWPEDAALGCKDLPEGPSEPGGGGGRNSEPDPLLLPSHYPHAPPSGQAGKNDTVWATGAAPNVCLHGCQPSDGKEQCREAGTGEHCLGRRGSGHLASRRQGLNLALKQGAFWGKHKGFGQPLVEAGTRAMRMRPQVREATWVCS